MKRSVAGERVTGGGDSLTYSGAVGIAADEQAGAAAGNEVNRGRFHTFEGGDGLLDSLGAMPASQTFNSKLDAVRTGSRGG